MLISKTVMATWNAKTYSHYVGLGYICTGMKDVFEVKVEDLTKGSHVRVDVLCDYCLEEGVEKHIFPLWKEYLRTKTQIITKDCCNECQNKKTQESNNITYGTKYNFNIDEVNKRTYQFGLASSKMQRYICNLVKGELNYSLEDRLWLDIAFPDEMIYCEYDGGGHNLNVKMGNVTQKYFDVKEQRRFFVLVKKGWKEMRIISRRDYTPTDEVILEIFKMGREILKDFHRVIFDYDNNKIITSKYEKDYDFGHLRFSGKIKA